METSSFFKQLRIVDIVSETSNCKSFILEPVDWEPVYQPGQFLTLVFNTKHGEKRRSYSISSAPDTGEPLTITVKKIDNGEFSRLLNYHAKTGDLLTTTGISGFFTLPANKEVKQYFFIAAGSGITPCFSLIKYLLQKKQEPLVLIYSNKSEEDTIFFRQLRELEKQYPDRFRLKLLFSNISNVYESRLSNWLLPQFLASYLMVKPSEAIFYVCGPFDYMKMVEITLLSQFPRENIVKENFLNWPRLILPVPPDSEPHRVRISFLGKTHELTVQYPVNILAEAKKHNIELPYSCEAGRCGSCAATCTSGKIWMAYNEVLTDREVAAGRVLICQGYAVGGDAEVSV